jgi:hypothetical protein
MTDNCEVAIAGGLRHDPLDDANDPRLSIDHRFELLLREVTRRRSVILAQVIDHRVPPSSSPSARICAPSRALRSLLAKMLHTFLTQDAATIARIRARPRSLSGQSGTGTLGLIMTSGWVMKKTVGMELSGRTEQFNRNFSSAPGGDKDG